MWREFVFIKPIFLFWWLYKVNVPLETVVGSLALLFTCILCQAIVRSHSRYIAHFGFQDFMDGKLCWVWHWLNGLQMLKSFLRNYLNDWLAWVCCLPKNLSYLQILQACPLKGMLSICTLLFLHMNHNKFYFAAANNSVNIITRSWQYQVASQNLPLIRTLVD